MAKSKKHPGFKAVQNKIARRQGISKKRAGAILAASSRRASAKAKRKNPRFNFPGIGKKFSLFQPGTTKTVNNLKKIKKLSSNGTFRNGNRHVCFY